MASGEDPNRHGITPSPQSWRNPSSSGGGQDMSLDLQLSELRRSLDVAITKIDGQLTVLLQKSDYAEQRARESAERVAAELAMRDAKMEHFESRMDASEREFNARFDNRDREHNALRARVYFMSGIATAIGGAIGIVSEVLMRHN